MKFIFQKQAERLKESGVQIHENIVCVNEKNNFHKAQREKAVVKWLGTVDVADKSGEVKDCRGS